MPSIAEHADQTSVADMTSVQSVSSTLASRSNSPSYPTAGPGTATPSSLQSRPHATNATPVTTANVATRVNSALLSKRPREKVPSNTFPIASSKPADCVEEQAVKRRSTGTLLPHVGQRPDQDAVLNTSNASNACSADKRIRQEAPTKATSKPSAVPQICARDSFDGQPTTHGAPRPHETNIVNENERARTHAETTADISRRIPSSTPSPQGATTDQDPIHRQS